MKRPFRNPAREVRLLRLFSPSRSGILGLFSPSRSGILRLASLLLLAGLAGTPRAAVINDYSVFVQLRRDSDLTVQERIKVDFTGEQRHGIFRHIPVVYERPAGQGAFSVPAAYALRLRVISVKDDADQAYRWKSWRDGRDLFLRIGDPDHTITGLHTYVLTYAVTRAINTFPDHDEFYWNVTGNQWEWPIRRVTCSVALPEGVDPAQVRVKTFTGGQGETGSTAQGRWNAKSYTVTAGPLQVGQGLTVLMGLPKGVFQPPGAWQSAVWFLSDNALPLSFLLVPFLAFGTMLSLFLRNGRDPEAGNPITVQYEPPARLSPAEVGTLVDERADVSDIVSTVLDLAVKGYLRITEHQTTTLLFFKNKDYEFTRLKPADSVLQGHETTFMTALFGSGESVMLSTLKQSFYVNLPPLRKALYTQLVEKGMFPVSPETVRNQYVMAGVVAVVIPVLLAFLANAVGVTSHLAVSPGLTAAAGVFSLAVTFGIITGFGRFMPRKTLEGARTARAALGFKEFVERVEKDRIARMAHDDPTVFERLLPYAVVLGCADEWANKFTDLITEPPSWYVSPAYSTGGFRPHVFVHDLGAGMNTMSSTFTSTPKSQAGSGGSGFSGGSSGGGFGGGGGGGW